MIKMGTEYVEKFGYRKYEGKYESRWKRIWSLSRFELIQTWHKSTVGKVLLIIIIVLNFFMITGNSMALSFILTTLEDPDEFIHAGLSGMIATYYGLESSVRSQYDIAGMSFPIGILIVGLFAIAGSGLFADDRQGKLFEIYLSKMRISEYVTGKIITILLYISLFSTLPLLILGAFSVQSLGLDHLEFLDYYFEIILYCTISSIVFGLGILIFSSLVEKRSYASLGFYLLYLFGSIFGEVIFFMDPSNEFLLLISPSTFFALLGFVFLQENELFTATGEQLILNDGSGLENFHVIGFAMVLILLMASFLYFKLRRLNTEEM